MIQRAVGIFILLCAVYLATFTGHPISSDEWQLADAARSTALYGLPAQPYTYTMRFFSTPPDDQVVVQLQVDSIQVNLLAPLIGLARIAPNISLMHTIWLFNVMVTALTGAVVYLVGRTLGYSERVATAVALIFGISTIAFPYSQMLFREPLLSLFGITAYGCAIRFQGQPRQRIGWFFAALAMLAGAALTKDAGLAFVPIVLAAAVPSFKKVQWRRTLPLALISGILVAGLTVLRYEDTLGRLLNTQFVENISKWLPTALPAYLISPGFSIWVFSPVLLAGWLGMILLARRGAWREVILPLLAVLGFAVGHAALHGQYWYGGLAWGTRFLVPITPFLCLWLLPVIHTAGADSRSSRRLQVGLSALILISTAVQLVAVWLPATRYTVWLEAQSKVEGRPILAWEDGVWDIRYHALRANWEEIGDAPSAIAWDVTGTGLIILPLCLMLGLIGGWIIARRRRAWLVLLLPMAFYFMLRVIYLDPRYGGDQAQLWDALMRLEQVARTGDAVILNSPVYRPFFMSYYHLETPIYMLDTPKGETIDPNQPPEIVSDHPEERAEPFFQMLLRRVAERSRRWLYLTEYTPYTPGRLRVTEFYLARHYYPAETLIDASEVRLLIYAPIPAPSVYVPPYPAIGTDVDFGPVRLVGLDVPLSARSGDFLPVSLLWTHEGWVDRAPFDYSINLTLVNRAGETVAQRVAQPLGTFGGMSLWERGGYYRDHHALTLPADLPNGEYDLWLLLVDWRDGKPLPIVGAGDAEYLTLATIRIEQGN
ncbi:MAG: hypothetical protein OHK0023_19610 [Anaerolineae bacterium]